MPGVAAETPDVGLVGRRVARLFGGVPYEGFVAAVRRTRAHGVLYRIHYDDGNREDLRPEELRAALLPAAAHAPAAGAPAGGDVASRAAPDAMAAPALPPVSDVSLPTAAFRVVHALDQAPNGAGHPDGTGVNRAYLNTFVTNCQYTLKQYGKVGDAAALAEEIKGGESGRFRLTVRRAARSPPVLRADVSTAL